MISIFSAVFVLSVFALMYSWLLIILFTKRLNKIDPTSKEKHSLFMAIAGERTYDPNLLSYIKKNKHKDLNDEKLNKLGRTIVNIYIPSLIIFVGNLLAMAVYYKFYVNI